MVQPLEDISDDDETTSTPMNARRVIDHDGGMSAGRHALEGTPLAPRTQTLWISCKTQWGGQPPSRPRSETAFALDKDLFVEDLRCARRGAALGVSSMTFKST